MKSLVMWGVAMITGKPAGNPERHRQQGANMDGTDQTRRVLYDDANVTVVQNRIPGSETVVIAFGDMLALAKGDTAWGGPPVKRAGFDLFSIMSKHRDWFPAKIMQPVLSCHACSPS